MVNGKWFYRRLEKFTLIWSRYTMYHVNTKKKKNFQKLKIRKIYEHNKLRMKMRNDERKTGGIIQVNNMQSS